jgi:hypothetical protein
MGCEKGNLFPDTVSKKKKKKRVVIKQREKVGHKQKSIPQKPGKEINTRKETKREKKSKKKTNRKTKVVNKKKEVVQPPAEKKKIEVVKSTAKEKIRKNGLQVQKEIEELEKEIRKKEEIWEIPAFLRRKEG